MLVAIAGLACDLFAESLFIGWLPYRIEAIGPFASFLTGAVANACYSVAGATLTVGSPFLRGPLRAWAWAIWTSGFALTIATLVGSAPGMVISTVALMTLLCPWVAMFSWKLMHNEQSIPV